MERLEEFDCVIAVRDLENGVKAGDIGTIDQVSNEGYLVDFDHDIERIIPVLFEDVKPTEWTLKRVEDRRKRREHSHH